MYLLQNVCVYVCGTCVGAYTQFKVEKNGEVDVAALYSRPQVGHLNGWC